MKRNKRSCRKKLLKVPLSLTNVNWNICYCIQEKISVYCQLRGGREGQEKSFNSFVKGCRWGLEKVNGTFNCLLTLCPSRPCRGKRWKKGKLHCDYVKHFSRRDDQRKHCLYFLVNGNMQSKPELVCFTNKLTYQNCILIRFRSLASKHTYIHTNTFFNNELFNVPIPLSNKSRIY